MSIRTTSVLLLLLGCASGAPVHESPRSGPRESAEFAFGSLDGSVVTSETTRGRVTALLFVTTYDLASQAAARRLSDVHLKHKPRFNAAAVVLEAAENAVLADVFRTSLGLSYPVALADAIELRSSEAFARVSGVPTLVVLDRDGGISLQRRGLFEVEELAGWLRSAEREAATP